MLFLDYNIKDIISMKLISEDVLSVHTLRSNQLLNLLSSPFHGSFIWVSCRFLLDLIDADTWAIIQSKTKGVRSPGP